jgi:hypothetical protein
MEGLLAMNSSLRENKPSADVLMTSMRAMGYSFESAVADIIDNSVSADAHMIQLKFPISPMESYVAICDDGWGMTRDDLFDAMKYGSEKKKNGRADSDLGRFGLGLKSSSLSQCRKLTVISKRDGVVSAYIWDLDVVEKQKAWYMVECSDTQIAELRCVEWLDNLEHGTVVLWENFDLIEKSSGNVYATLMKYQEKVSDYLSLIFHRYLNRVGPGKVVIRVNNFQLSGLDPFLENHNKTTIRKRIEIPVEDTTGIERMVIVQPYVLPFQKDLSAEDKRLSGGIENYRSKQGFYIYRNERLIVWGKWFGRPRDELTKYARIKVDIPNALDDIWGIDIKKQNAEIPASIKNRLTRAVDDAMDTAIRAQTYRGRIEKVDDEADYIWDRIKERGDQYSYRINRNSKIFDLIREHVDDEVWSYIDMVLEEIECAVPYQQIYIDKSQNKIDDTISDERAAEIEAKARMLISMAMEMGTKTRTQIVDSLFISEPFSKYPVLKDKLLEEDI